MRSEVLAAGAMIASAIVWVRYMDNRTADAPQLEPAVAEAPSEERKLQAYYAALGPEVRIPRGPHNQYFVTAAVNHRPASFLVDTGASYVALRESEARAAGVFTSRADYTHAVRTANGETRAALVKLQRIEIDGLRVDNVDAFILPDAQLGMNLLGMSFLSRLESVEARRGELVLKG